jgi:hypothetical protein
MGALHCRAARRQAVHAPGRGRKSPDAAEEQEQMPPMVGIDLEALQDLDE